MKFKFQFINKYIKVYQHILFTKRKTRLSVSPCVDGWRNSFDTVLAFITRLLRYFWFHKCEQVCTVNIMNFFYSFEHFNFSF